MYVNTMHMYIAVLKIVDCSENRHTCTHKE